nr:hypothetical protein [Tanacetum cinerariifolium]
LIVVNTASESLLDDHLEQFEHREVELLLVAFDYQLKVFHTPLDHDASSKHSKRDVKGKAFFDSMPLYNLEFSDSDDSSLRIHIASRLSVNSKTVELLKFTPPMGDSPEGMLVIADWFFNPHSLRHQVFYPLDIPDEEPSAGPDRVSKTHGEGKEPDSTSALTETTTRSAGRSTEGSRSRQASASESALAEEPMQTTSHMEEPSHLEFDTGAEDQPIVQSS